jgi:hypothetical protein
MKGRPERIAPRDLATLASPADSTCRMTLQSTHRQKFLDSSGTTHQAAGIPAGDAAGYPALTMRSGPLVGKPSVNRA